MSPQITFFHLTHASPKGPIEFRMYCENKNEPILEDIQIPRMQATMTGLQVEEYLNGPKYDNGVIELRIFTDSQGMIRQDFKLANSDFEILGTYLMSNESWSNWKKQTWEERMRFYLFNTP